ncbi:hypothetical protein [Azospirillum endophyticum]
MPDGQSSAEQEVQQALNACATATPPSCCSANSFPLPAARCAAASSGSVSPIQRAEKRKGASRRPESKEKVRDNIGRPQYPAIVFHIHHPLNEEKPQVHHVDRLGDPAFLSLQKRGAALAH